MSSRQEDKQRRHQQRLAAEQAAERAGRRRRRLQVAGAAALLVAAAAVAIALVTSGGGHSTTAASHSAPAASGLLASTAGEAGGASVDGIKCETTERVLFHIHAHLAGYVDGHQKLIPEGIGIPAPRQVQQTADGPFVVGGSCFYWLHSHTRDGIIHIESPVQRVYTLGNYFDLWKQPLSGTQVGPATGRFTAYLDGKRYPRGPSSIPLKAHELIQLDVGTPVVRPQPFAFPQGL